MKKLLLLPPAAKLAGTNVGDLKALMKSKDLPDRVRAATKKADILEAVKSTSLAILSEAAHALFVSQANAEKELVAAYEKWCSAISEKMAKTRPKEKEQDPAPANAAAPVSLPATMTEPVADMLKSLLGELETPNPIASGRKRDREDSPPLPPSPQKDEMSRTVLLADLLADREYLGSQKVHQILIGIYGTTARLKVHPAIATFLGTFGGAVLSTELRTALELVWTTLSEGVQRELTARVSAAPVDDKNSAILTGAGTELLYEPVEKLSKVWIKFAVNKWVRDGCSNRDPEEARIFEILRKHAGFITEPPVLTPTSGTTTEHAPPQFQGHRIRSCFRCGETDHTIKACKARSDVVCAKCGKKGHKSKACRRP